MSPANNNRTNYGLLSDGYFIAKTDRKVSYKLPVESNSINWIEFLAQFMEGNFFIYSKTLLNYIYKMQSF